MPNGIVWEGLEAFKAQLRHLPAELTGEASGIVANAAHTAAQEIVDKYPTVTGNLKDGVKTSQITAGEYGVGYVVKSTAPHAHLYEHGTQARQTAIGANRGAMPPRPVVGQVASRRRRQMYDELTALLKRAGFQVTGDASG